MVFRDRAILLLGAIVFAKLIINGSVNKLSLESKSLALLALGLWSKTFQHSVSSYIRPASFLLLYILSCDICIRVCMYLKFMTKLLNLRFCSSYAGGTLHLLPTHTSYYKEYAIYFHHSPL